MVTIEPVNVSDSTSATSSSTQAAPSRVIVANPYDRKKKGESQALPKVNPIKETTQTELVDPAETIRWLQALSDTNILFADSLDDTALKTNELFADNLDELVLKDLEEAEKEDEAEKTTATAQATVIPKTVAANPENQAIVNEPEPQRKRNSADFEFQPPAKRTASANYPQSNAMLEFQRSYAQLSHEEKQGLLQQQVTPSTVGWASPTGVIPTTSSFSTRRSLFQNEPTPVQAPLLFQNTITDNQVTAFKEINPSVDPLLAIMSQPRLSVFQALIKDLASISLAATEHVQQKTLAARKLHDPENDAVPRSIRQKNFTLTTIEELRGHSFFKKLQMQVAEHCEQHKQTLTAAIKELAKCEVTWLKILRVQKIIKPMKTIIGSLLFRLEHTIERPSFPATVKQNTYHFFIFYWMMQMYNNETHTTGKTIVEFLDLPFNDIVASAAKIMIENSPQDIADTIEKLNSPELNWDKKDFQTGLFLSKILPDLHTIVKAAVIDHVEYQQAIKQEKQLEAQTLAYVNKQRVTSATVLTHETLQKVSNKVATATINEADLRRRQDELDKKIAKTEEELNKLKKQQQPKNWKGGSSAPTPGQIELNTVSTATASTKQVIIRHPRFTPPVTEPPAVIHVPHQKPTAEAIRAPLTEIKQTKVKPPYKKRKNFKKSK